MKKEEIKTFLKDAEKADVLAEKITDLLTNESLDANVAILALTRIISTCIAYGIDGNKDYKQGIVTVTEQLKDCIIETSLKILDNVHSKTAN